MVVCIYDLSLSRLACRDIGGSDPERMAAPRVAEYVQALFKESLVQVRETGFNHTSKKKEKGMVSPKKTTEVFYS